VATWLAILIGFILGALFGSKAVAALKSIA
jgi:hypothetical protein